MPKKKMKKKTIDTSKLWMLNFSKSFVTIVPKSVINAALPDFSDSIVGYNRSISDGGSINDVFAALKETSKMVKSKVWDNVIVTGTKNALDDLKSGKLDNSQRESASMFGTEDDSDYFGGFDESFDDNEFNDDESDTTSSTSQDTAFNDKKLAEDSFESAKATIIATTKYHAGVNLLVGQNLVSGLSNIYKVNTAQFSFMTSATKPFYDASLNFYSNTTTLLSALGSNLEEIKNSLQDRAYVDEIASRKLALEKKNKKQSGPASLVKRFTSWVDEATGGVEFDMIRSMAQNPLKYLMSQFIVPGLYDKYMPSQLKNSFKDFNEIFKNFPTIIKTNMKSWKDDDSFLKQKVFELLNPSIEKNKIGGMGFNLEEGLGNFDGDTKKSVTNIIPSYLSKILNVLEHAYKNTFKDSEINTDNELIFDRTSNIFKTKGKRKKELQKEELEALLTDVFSTSNTKISERLDDIKDALSSEIMVEEMSKDPEALKLFNTLQEDLKKNRNNKKKREEITRQVNSLKNPFKVLAKKQINEIPNEIFRFLIKNNIILSQDTDISDSEFDHLSKNAKLYLNYILENVEPEDFYSFNKEISKAHSEYMEKQKKLYSENSELFLEMTEFNPRFKEIVKKFKNVKDYATAKSDIETVKENEKILFSSYNTAKTENIIPLDMSFDEYKYRLNYRNELTDKNDDASKNIRLQGEFFSKTRMDIRKNSLRKKLLELVERNISNGENVQEFLDAFNSIENIEGITIDEAYKLLSGLETTFKQRFDENTLNHKDVYMFGKTANNELANFKILQNITKHEKEEDDEKHDEKAIRSEILYKLSDNIDSLNETLLNFLATSGVDKISSFVNNSSLPFGNSKGGLITSKNSLKNIQLYPSHAKGMNILPNEKEGSDGVIVSAQKGEGIINKKGMRKLGSDGLEKLNSGKNPKDLLFSNGIIGGINALSIMMSDLIYGTGGRNITTPDNDPNFVKKIITKIKRIKTPEQFSLKNTIHNIGEDYKKIDRKKIESGTLFKTLLSPILKNLILPVKETLENTFKTFFMENFGINKTVKKVKSFGSKFQFEMKRFLNADGTTETRKDILNDWIEKGTNVLRPEVLYVDENGNEKVGKIYDYDKTTRKVKLSNGKIYNVSDVALLKPGVADTVNRLILEGNVISRNERLRQKFFNTNTPIYNYNKFSPKNLLKSINNKIMNETLIGKIYSTAKDVFGAYGVYYRVFGTTPIQVVEKIIAIEGNKILFESGQLIDSKDVKFIKRYKGLAAQNYIEKGIIIGDPIAERKYIDENSSISDESTLMLANKTFRSIGRLGIESTKFTGRRVKDIWNFFTLKSKISKYKTQYLIYFAENLQEERIDKVIQFVDNGIIVLQNGDYYFVKNQVSSSGILKSKELLSEAKEYLNKYGTILGDQKSKKYFCMSNFGIMLQASARQAVLKPEEAIAKLNKKILKGTLNIGFKSFRTALKSTKNLADGLTWLVSKKKLDDRYALYINDNGDEVISKIVKVGYNSVVLSDGNRKFIEDIRIVKNGKHDSVLNMIASGHPVVGSSFESSLLEGLKFSKKNNIINRVINKAIKPIKTLFRNISWNKQKEKIINRYAIFMNSNGIEDISMIVSTYANGNIMLANGEIRNINDLKIVKSGKEEEVRNILISGGNIINSMKASQFIEGAQNNTPSNNSSIVSFFSKGLNKSSKKLTDDQINLIKQGISPNDYKLEKDQIDPFNKKNEDLVSYSKRIEAIKLSSEKNIERLKFEIEELQKSPFNELSENIEKLTKAMEDNIAAKDKATNLLNNIGPISGSEYQNKRRALLEQNRLNDENAGINSYKFLGKIDKQKSLSNELLNSSESLKKILTSKNLDSTKNLSKANETGNIEGYFKEKDIAFKKMVDLAIEKQQSPYEIVLQSIEKQKAEEIINRQANIPTVETVESLGEKISQELHKIFDPAKNIPSNMDDINERINKIKSKKLININTSPNKSNISTNKNNEPSLLDSAINEGAGKIGGKVLGKFAGKKGFIGKGARLGQKLLGVGGKASVGGAAMTAGTKFGGKALLGVGGKALGKALPGIGAALAAKNAYDDFKEGDTFGGVMNTVGAATNFIPGLGWVAGLGIQGGLAARDWYKNNKKQNLIKNESVSSDPLRNNTPKLAKPIPVSRDNDKELLTTSNSSLLNKMVTLLEKIAVSSGITANKLSSLPISLQPSKSAESPKQQTINLETKKNIFTNAKSNKLSTGTGVTPPDIKNNNRLTLNSAVKVL